MDLKLCIVYNILTAMILQILKVLVRVNETLIKRQHLRLDYLVIGAITSYDAFSKIATEFAEKLVFVTAIEDDNAKPEERRPFNPRLMKWGQDGKLSEQHSAEFSGGPEEVPADSRHLQVWFGVSPEVRHRLQLRSQECNEHKLWLYQNNELWSSDLVYRGADMRVTFTWSHEALPEGRLECGRLEKAPHDPYPQALNVSPK
ncbi:hypothetical protein C0J52_19428 [Blattella germanica]|nr:hypothetical protein C0J52_19428 [Blattella germanica]